jgi:hypothetical protein
MTFDRPVLRPLSKVCRYIHRAAENGFGPRWQKLFGPKIFTVSGKDWLLSCRVTWTWSERFNWYNRQIKIISRNTKTRIQQSSLVPPSGPPGPGNLYRLPPRLVGTACTLYSLFNDAFESCEFHGGRSGTEAEFPPCSHTLFLLISIPRLFYTHLSRYDSSEQVALFRILGLKLQASSLWSTRGWLQRKEVRFNE